MAVISLSWEESKSLSEVIHCAYTDVFSPSTWSEILAQVRKAIPADSLGAMFYGQEGLRPVSCVMQDADEQLFQDYRDRFWLDDAVREASIRHGMLVCRPTDVMPDKEWLNSAVYTGFVSPNGYEHTLSMGVVSETGIPVSLHLFRNRNDKPFSDRELQFLELLQPHLTDAFSHALQSADLLRTQYLFQAGFDALPRAIFVFTSDGRLMCINKSASSLLKDADRVSVDAMSCITGLIARLKTSLQEETDPAAQTVETNLTIGDTAFSLVALRAESSDLSTYHVVKAEEKGNRLLMAVRRLAHTHGLSPREAEITVMIARGLPNKVIAEALFISQYTVKDHLKSIFDKLGISQRSEVVAKLLGL